MNLTIAEMEIICLACIIIAGIYASACGGLLAVIKHMKKKK